MFFRKGGILPRNLSFTFQGNRIESVYKFVYLALRFRLVVLLLKPIKPY